MKFLDFINEKVSKKEVSDALKNRNIYIGAEFEFIFDMDEYTDSNMNSLYDDAVKEYQKYMRDVDESNSAIHRLDREKSELSDDIYRIKTYDIYGAENDLRDAKYELEDAEDDDEIKKLKSAIDDIEDDLDDMRLDLQNKEEELQSLEDYGYDRINYPRMYEDGPYFTYMMEIGEYGYYTSFDWFAIAADEDHPPIYPPDPPENFPDDIKEVFDNSDALSNAPFKKYKFGDYGDNPQKIGDTYWRIEPDQSLSEGGVEVISPPMRLPDFLKILPKMFSWIDLWGDTDSSCGFHVHMSVDGVDLEDSIDPVKLILFTDEDKIWKYFDTRKDNTYVISVKDKLKTKGKINKNDLKNLFKDKRLMLIDWGRDHSDSINFMNLDEGHIEFRYMGGPNYHKSLNKVIESIAIFAYNLSLACDPEFKKKEYIKKLVRIFNKMDMYIHRFAEVELDYPLKNPHPKITSDHIKIIKNVKDEHRRKFDSLRKVYKIDSNLSRKIFANKFFADLAKKELTDSLIGKLPKDIIDIIV